jgi:hypothetical protein
VSFTTQYDIDERRRVVMDADLFEYEMRKIGYRTSKQRADALEISLSAYYRRIKNTIECTREDIEKVASLLGWDTARRIFFGNEVS